MRALGDRLFGLCGLGLALAVGCSVFPESAVLPVESGGGSAGEPSDDGGAPVGEAGDGGRRPNPGTAGGGAASGGGGGGGSSVAEAGAGGEAQGGTGGTGATCDSPQFLSLRVLADLWIGSAKPGDTHEGEALIYASGGTDERRTLLGLDIPAPNGAVLVKAELVLTLVSNADVSKAARELELWTLGGENAPDPKHTSWTNWGAGNQRRWKDAGADLGLLVAKTQIAADTSTGRVAFEVTEATRAAFTTERHLAPVVILESGSAPAAPAELAFTSLEGNASGSAVLELTYCPP